MDRVLKGKEKETMDYKASKLDATWASERRLADQIMRYIRKHKLQFQLDDLTRGKGNCFMIAVLQQLNRREFFGSLTQEMKTVARNLDQMKFRKMVKYFIDTSNDERIIEMKNHHNMNYMAGADLGENMPS